jgi:hypothetical protein
VRPIRANYNPNETIYHPESSTVSLLHFSLYVQDVDHALSNSKKVQSLIQDQFSVQNVYALPKLIDSIVRLCMDEYQIYYDDGYDAGQRDFSLLKAAAQKLVSEKLKEIVYK